MKFSLEKLVKTPIIPEGAPFLTPNGCGCAFGIAYVATGAEINWNQEKSTTTFCAVSNGKAAQFKFKDLAEDNPSIFHIVSEAESRLWRKEEPEGVKKWMIDQLVALGVTDAEEIKHGVTV